MNIEAVVDSKRRMLDEGILIPSGTVLATHYSHNIGLQHDDLVRILEPHDILVAYDGMRIEV